MSHHGAEYTVQKEWMKDYDSNDYGLCYICGLEIEEPTGVNLLEYLEENQNLEFFFAPGPRVMHIAKEKLNRMLALKPIIHLNELEAEAITGISDIKEAGRHLHALTGNHVIITLGVQGTFYIEKDGTEGMIPSVPAEHVVDTIGAGDSHAGSVIACLTNDMTLHDSIAYANKVAAATVGVKGMSLTKDQLPNK